MTLAFFDFDGTIADTFTRCPRGAGVEEAYRIAVGTIFTDHGLGYYNDNGGLRNRAPGEVVLELLNYFGPRGQDLMKERIAGMNDILTKRRDELNQLGVYKFTGRVTSRNVGKVATELLVTLKLGVLMGQIGNELGGGFVWPKPIKSFTEFWHQVRTDESIKTVVVSSGHRAFIDKFFQTYKLPPPHAMVTDDETRHLNPPVHKPDEHIVRLGIEALQVDPVVHDRFLFGDDPNKDGELARRSGCEFVLIDPSNKHPNHPNRVANWRCVLEGATGFSF